MSALALKLVVTPALIGLASLAGRRWGDAVAGWLIALPLVSGPTVFFIELEHGRRFAAGTAVGSLGGAAAEVAFCLGYLALARRGPALAVAAASLGFAAVATGVRLAPLRAALPLPLLPLLAGVLCVLWIGLALLGSVRWERGEALLPSRYELPLRMAAGTGVVVALTESARFLGPRLSGLLVTYPLLTAILAVSAHRLEGPRTAVDVLRGLVLGLFSFAAFFFAAAALVPRLGLPAFAVASAAALAIQVLSLRFARRRPEPRGS
ncbi:MAG TPA: hypothetical protein VFL66_05255 [Gaiellaceae bacterium]|nr:hypothetical protein [Gaiellaceae bacterium]